MEWVFSAWGSADASKVNGGDAPLTLDQQQTIGKLPGLQAGGSKVRYEQYPKTTSRTLLNVLHMIK